MSLRQNAIFDGQPLARLNRIRLKNGTNCQVGLLPLGLTCIKVYGGIRTRADKKIETLEKTIKAV